VKPGIALERLLAALQEDGITLEALRKKRVFCIANGNPHPTHTWSFLQCLTAELRIPAGLHILNASTWYRVSDDFVRQVDTDVDAIESSSSTLPTWETSERTRTTSEFRGRAEEGWRSSTA
jgi:uncharacterized protein (TIGR04141 family)